MSVRRAALFPTPRLPLRAAGNPIKQELLQNIPVSNPLYHIPHAFHNLRMMVGRDIPSGLYFVKTENPVSGRFDRQFIF